MDKIGKKQNQVTPLRLFVWFIIIIIEIVFLLFTFFLLRPFDNEITQDRPIMNVLCEMQFHCHSGVGRYYCTDNKSNEYYSILVRWKDFHGCNNQTKRYDSSINRLIVEYCSCGGIQ